MSPNEPHISLGIKTLGFVVQWFLPKITVLPATKGNQNTETTEGSELFFLKGGYVSHWLVSFFAPFLSLRVQLCTEGGREPANFVSQDPLPTSLHLGPAYGSTVGGLGSGRTRRSLFLKASPMAQ